MCTGHDALLVSYITIYPRFKLDFTLYCSLFVF